MKQEIFADSHEKTQIIGACLGAQLNPGDVILLYGDLGAGKTTFSQGVAKGMGINDQITSPTFTLINEYISAEAKLVHMDLYRLASPEQVADLGFEDYLTANVILLIEWPDRLGFLKPINAISVTIEELHEGRNITIEGSKTLIFRNDAL